MAEELDLTDGIVCVRGEGHLDMRVLVRLGHAKDGEGHDRRVGEGDSLGLAHPTREADEVDDGDEDRDGHRRVRVCGVGLEGVVVHPARVAVDADEVLLVVYDHRIKVDGLDKGALTRGAVERGRPPLTDDMKPAVDVQVGDEHLREGRCLRLFSGEQLRGHDLVDEFAAAGLRPA